MYIFETACNILLHHVILKGNMHVPLQRRERTAIIYVRSFTPADNLSQVAIIAYSTVLPSMQSHSYVKMTGNCEGDYCVKCCCKLFTVQQYIVKSKHYAQKQGISRMHAQFHLEPCHLKNYESETLTLTIICNQEEEFLQDFAWRNDQLISTGSPYL